MVTFPKNDDEGLSLLSQPTTTGSDYLSTLFELPTNKEVLTSGKLSPLTIPNETNHKIRSSLIPFFSHPTNLIPSKTTGIGSVVFLLYHIVFCLAQAATITRPHSTNPSVGIMSQMAALGIVTAGPLFLYFLGEDIPAIYPASDLFLAPFLAQLAREIDTVLFEKDLHNNDTVFMATFGAVVGVGFLLSGFLCVLAARFQLANLGAFLPYSVLCGFFTTIGILMYSLGFSVDVGTPIGEVLWSGDWQVIRHALGHHFPSLLIGILMHFMGPKNPLFVIWILLGTVFGSYIVLWMTGTTLTQAQELQWFFAAKDLYVDHQHRTIGSYGPPAPFGTWFAVWNGEVVWEAFFAGIPTMLSLVFLYVVRCSLHSAALKKNIPNVTRKKPHINESASSIITGQETKTNKKKTRSLTLGSILESGYGYSQLLSGFMGGIAIAPSVAASLTLFELGAEAPPPQYGSCLLVLIFLVWDFSLVQYIPKPAFSCLMVLAGMDMCRTWVVVSYQKTKAKLEWTVGPILVVLAFSIGVLNAIFCGIACSTFIFAANFYRVVS